MGALAALADEGRLALAAQHLAVEADHGLLVGQVVVEGRQHQPLQAGLRHVCTKAPAWITSRAVRSSIHTMTASNWPASTAASSPSHSLRAFLAYGLADAHSR
jgi:hypothetical protein